MLSEFIKLKNYIIADKYPLTYYTGQGAKSYRKMLPLHCVLLQHFGNPDFLRVLRGRAPEPSERNAAEGKFS